MEEQSLENESDRSLFCYLVGARVRPVFHQHTTGCSVRGRLRYVLTLLLDYELLKLLAVPHYSVAVQGVEDVQKAVNFANDKDLYLVVKNTGHSQ